ncbi:hypothetical protein B0T18DRAFT_408420 [Schizothecium vesticola]|uniref:Uncharacterized protein n=1 Tax=Schizothecium vesticola TaxID=314040 RepID=A0AA40K8Q8_9PEZI|nr:hypothetical protein B0T18DRAFT_408420 [Schizothecium vesticola]
MEQSEFSHRTRGGLVGVVGILGTNGNTILLTSWFLISVLSDPTLLFALRSEISTTTITPPSGTRTFNAQALTSLPLLQSVYTGLLRLYVSAIITLKVSGQAARGKGVCTSSRLDNSSPYGAVLYK